MNYINEESFIYIYIYLYFNIKNEFEKGPYLKVTLRINKISELVKRK